MDAYILIFLAYVMKLMEWFMVDESTLQLFRLQAGICKTLADPNRLLILHELRDGEMSVGQLTSSLNIPQSNMSRHLAVLREHNVVTTRREGTTIYYSLANPKIAQACDLVHEVLEGQLTRNQALAGGWHPVEKTE
jgi:ArsR family transcriptional regulator, virulence genes transcriptional regulator